MKLTSFKNYGFTLNALNFNHLKNFFLSKGKQNHLKFIDSFIIKELNSFEKHS